MRNYLYLYGNYSIKNAKFTLGNTTSDTADGVNIQKMSLARSYGSRVVNTTYNDKSIEINGEVVDITTSENKLEDLTIELHKIYAYQDRYFRIIPDYQIICDGQSTTGVTLGDDGANLAVDTSFYQFSQDPNDTSSSVTTPSSLKFDVIVANFGTNKATITRTIPGVDLSSKIGTGNIEFWLDIPDVYYVTSIDFRVGQDSSNYWSKNFTANYENKVLENGVNYFSVPFNISSTVPRTVNKMTATGSPTFAVTDYVQITINYSASAVDITNCHFGEVFWVNEDRVRNYPTYREGQVDFSRNYVFSPNMRTYKANLLNYKGYGMATHEILTLDITGFSGISNTSVISLPKGSYEPQPKFSFTVASATNLTDVKITNLTTNQNAQFTNAWATSDVGVLDKLNNTITRNNLPQDFSGKIPSFNLGNNWIKLETIGSTVSSITQTTQNSERLFYGDSSSQPFIAQSFTSPAVASVITSIEVLVRGFNDVADNHTRRLSLAIDSAGNPSTALGYGAVSYASLGSLTWHTTTFNQLVSASTTYWITLANFSGFGYQSYGYWGEDTGASYAGGQGKYWTGSAWATTGRDFCFKVNYSTSVSNLNYSIKYFPLYQ